MSGIMLQVDASGKLTECKDPYTVIHCETEYDFNRLEYLLDLGRATEKAFEETEIAMFFSYWNEEEDTGVRYVDEDKSFRCDSPHDLLEWAKKEE